MPKLGWQALRVGLILLASVPVLPRVLLVAGDLDVLID